MTADCETQATVALGRLLTAAPAADRAVLLRVRYLVADTPTPAQCQDLGVEGARVVGGFWPDPAPPTIILFAANVRRLGIDPAAVVAHEVAHALDWDHDGRRSGATGAMVPAYDWSRLMEMSQAPLVRQPVGMMAAPRPSSAASCRACTLHRTLGEVRALADGLRQWTAAEGRIPWGLGGTVPLIREGLHRAHVLLSEITLPGRAGELRACARSVDQALRRAQTWQTPETVAPLAAAVDQAWQCSYRVAWVATQRPWTA